MGLEARPEKRFLENRASETKGLWFEKPPKTLFPDGPLGFLPGFFLPPLLAPPAAQIQLADHRRGLQKTPVQLHPTPDLRGLFGRYLEGFQLPFPPDGKLILAVEVLAVRAAAVGLTADALALDERTRQHFAQGTQAADETATPFQFGIRGHKGPLI